MRSKLESQMKEATVQRSLDWETVKRGYLKTHRECAFCGATTKLDVHHKIPVKVRRDLELNEDNFMTLCSKAQNNCHFVHGHFYNWDRYNTCIEVDAAVWRTRIKVAKRWR